MNRCMDSRTVGNLFFHSLLTTRRFVGLFPVLGQFHQFHMFQTRPSAPRIVGAAREDIAGVQVLGLLWGMGDLGTVARLEMMDSVLWGGSLQNLEFWLWACFYVSMSGLGPHR